MIIICEPQCKAMSHEKVNSGFVYGLRLSYPQEKIIFFADTAHFEAIKNILKNDKASIDNFEHIPINFNASKSYSIAGIIKYYLLFKKIFNEILSAGANKIFFLSTNPIILYTIKKLKQQKKFKNISCAFVLHGELEDIANKNCMEPYTPQIKYRRTVKAKIAKLLNNSKREIIKKVWLFTIRKTAKKIKQPFLWLHSKYSLTFKKRLRVKKMMMWQHSNHYHYIALSPHIVENAKDYLNTDYLNFHTVIMPTIFTKPLQPADNQFIKFAVFGYGDSAQMYEMLLLLSKKQISKPYEIKIISMDNKGTMEFPNLKINDVNKGKFLPRKEMEDALPDVDVFINLYDINRHKFGCSASIFEAFAYLKPVLHLSNDGYNYFNKPEKPIGFRCENLNEYVEKMCDMIENYHLYKKELNIFRKNMIEYREEYAIENNLHKLKKSFTFD